MKNTTYTREKLATPTRHQILNAMLNYGGSFAQALAKAAMVADSSNLERIKSAFPEIWERYTEMAKNTLPACSE